jgi:hypothetical protein
MAMLTLPTLEQFLSGLRTAWQQGEARPTSVPKAKPKRLRRRPDPFLAVTTELREWFEAEHWRTSRELLERLQAEYPGIYPDGQLRTLQRRLKQWRREPAHRMVFGTMTADPCIAPGDVKGSLLSVGANDYFSDRHGGPKSPVDLPLRSHVRFQGVRARVHAPRMSSRVKAVHGWRRSLWTTVAHALMRGLDTALPTVCPGLSLSWNGHRLRIDGSIGHQAQRRELPTMLRLRLCTAKENSV